ncbi:DNA adenine methylase [Neobacillus sp. PS3-40]|uniref:DNA adenine methylase n=1 Tax=Neobacillus sp. PS3-40 TaxID=3070679 RepID=UPI0027E18F5C|nr:DNA adenine methylase [Neobacillus sp. PS3-40]WML43139.1 DNA adenine methylase [Neobacillus sp. PS3-40]
MRYIGSKEKLLNFIYDFIESKVDRGSDTLTFADLFTGTATVSKFFRNKGYKVIANDILTVCVIWAKAALASNSQITFNKLANSKEIRKQEFTNLFPKNIDLVLNHLNSLKGKEGFIYTEYSPEGTNNRMYLTGENASKIDAIRNQIKLWKASNLINESEEALLIASLLLATNRVANIAGTYGAFLKKWDKRAFNPIKLELIDTPTNDNLDHIVIQQEVQQISESIVADVVYLDPPYNFRQYGAYYHVLETIAVGDSPIVTGKTGLRPWQEKKSDFCYKGKAAIALKEVINKLKINHIFLSYNADGILEHEEILEILREKGTVEFKDISFQRYKSNNGGSGELKVKERLYYVKSKSK